MKVLGHPEKGFKSIHIGGTNGKGSTSHMVASCLQSGGYRVGLYTSPHLLDYRERIRINGIPCSEDFVVQFVSQWKALMLELGLSFFEMSVGMAFVYFEKEAVDVAVIEVGMGGRLDSTNVITPLVAAITNIDLDHQAFLGNTRAAIAEEKAGIFKPGIPVIIGERHPETDMVFERMAQTKGLPLYFAEDFKFDFAPTDLKGNYQHKNQRLARVILSKLPGFSLTEAHINKGLKHVVQSTGLSGRWQIVSEAPFTVLDTAHNPHGLRETMGQFTQISNSPMHIVFGMVQDKDVYSILSLLPLDARYYFCAPSIPRGLPSDHLTEVALKMGLAGTDCVTVGEAWQQAQKNAKPIDRIYIGGSTFVVADALVFRNAN